jgi:predicted nucleic acid-binding protein
MRERRFPRPRRRVLVDSAAYYALAEPREARRHDAVAILSGITKERWQTFTTNFVIAEAHALLLARIGHDVAARFVLELDRDRGTTVVRASLADEQHARRIIEGYRDKDFSLTDAISFAVMERLDIPYAFTFDRHFAQYGVQVLTPASFG